MVRHTSLKAVAVFCFLLALIPVRSFGQSPTGTIAGQVTDSQGRAVAGATVTATSPSIQGAQKTATTAEGNYLFKFLPPGDYTLSFEAAGFAAATSTKTVAATEPVTVDVSLKPAGVREAVTVTAEAPSFVNTLEGAANLKQTLMNSLPTARTLLAAVNLAPAAHATGPDGHISIAGAVSYENSFMVNGVQIQDNLRGDPNNLFIEDAIQETTVSSSSISAEYGRFTGGIVNVVTRSGGNQFSGSLREGFTNDKWRTVSPFGETKRNSTIPTSTVTVGGPIAKDRLWFFGAGRFVNSKVARETGYTRTPYTFGSNEKRFELKATQAIGATQRVEVGYTGIRRSDTNNAWPSASTVMDLNSLTNPSYPESLAQVHYTGTFKSKLFLEGQFSMRALTFKNSGGTKTDLINGTPLQDQTTGAWWWAPNFCAVCPEEQRNNSSVVVKGSYFLSNASGAHDLVFGYDGFNDKTRADNHQSASDYHIWATGSEVVNGTVYPIIEPGFSTYIINWPVQQGSKGTNFRTHSLFVNDKWSYNRHLSFNLGLRYDKNAGRDAADQLVSNDSLVSPRLGLAWDPAGDGRTTVRVSGSRYVAALNNSVAGSSSAAGNPAIIAYFYDGPGINDGSGPLVTTDVALQRVFSWYNAAKPDPFFVDLPGVATKIDGSLRSPHVDELTVGVSREFGPASVRADVVVRKFGDFYAERIDRTTGQVFDNFGQEFDLKLIENTNTLSRRYRALNLSGTYRASADLNIGGNYTLSRLWGNYDGENIRTGPLASEILTYPEYSQTAWAFPEGDLAADQRHRARIFAVYDLPWGRSVANMSVGVIEQMESGSPYGAVGAAVVSPFVKNPGYATAPDTNTYYFTARDAFRTASMARTDLAFNLSRRLPSARGAEVFAQFQLLNAFNQFQLFNIAGDDINTTVLTAVDDPGTFAVFNPFTKTPVEGVNWKKSSKFGTAISKDAYTLPRTFRFSVGVRF